MIDAYDHIDAEARLLCAAHQDASPTRQPCAACAQDAAEQAQCACGLTDPEMPCLDCRFREEASA